jgi:hypothetical protein
VAVTVAVTVAVVVAEADSSVTPASITAQGERHATW